MAADRATPAGKQGSVATRFQKGRSGNPKGRPRSKPRAPASDFDLIIARTLTMTHQGAACEVTVEEALQHKTYQDAVGGSRAARREVLKWIEKREQWLAGRAPRLRLPVFVFDRHDPVNANQALLLLGIAEADARFPSAPQGDRLRLQPWAVQAALSRCRRPLSAEDIAEIERCTRDADKLRWPAVREHDPDE